MTSPAPRPDTIDKLQTAIYPSYALLAGAQLDLFTPLKDGPMSAEQIADAIGVRPTRLKALLYALVAAKLLTVEGDLFANTPESDHFLVRGKPTYRGGGYEAVAQERWNGISRTAESIRTDSPQAKHDFSALPPEQQESFFRAQHPAGVRRGHDLLARYDFSSCRNLLDVGGGTGGLAITVTEAHPHIRATVVDLPPVIPITQRYINEAGAADRVQVMASDVVNQALTGSFDVAVLSALLPVLSPDQARRTLRNVHQVIKPGGVIYVADAGTLDNSRLSPQLAVENNLYFINIFDEGQASTEQERREWLTEAGFEGVEREVVPNGNSIMVARKPE